MNGVRRGTRRLARRAAVIAALSVCALGPTQASAQQAPPSTPADIAEACRALGALPATCTGLGKLGERVAAECRRLGIPESRCVLPLGKTVLRSRIAAFERGDTHRILGLQYELANDVPFRDAPFVGTHNSFNNTAELPTVSHTDSNQQLSLTDQLRTDVRSIELDVHWFPTLRAGGRRAPVVCHAADLDAGCTTERLLSETLPAIAAWLRSHRDQVLLLYVEDDIVAPSVLDPRDGHVAVQSDLIRALGPQLYRPRPRAGASCETLPLGLSRKQVLAAGKQVVVVSGCSAGWGGTVFNWNPVEVEGRPHGYRAYPGCDQDENGDGKADFPRATYSSRLVRYFEDSTFLSAATGSTDDGINPFTAKRMSLCGVDLLGLDQLLPDDGRLDALVWSWAKGEPNAARGDCAVQTTTKGRLPTPGFARWSTRSCAEHHPPACRRADGSWLVERGFVPYARAHAFCAVRGAVFAAPRTGFENAELSESGLSDGGDLWIGQRRVRGRFISEDVRSSANRSSPRSGADLGAGGPRLRLRFGFRRGRTRTGRSCARSRVNARVLGRDGRRVRRVLFVRNGRHFRVDRRAPFRRLVHRRHRGRSHRHRVRARVRMKDGRVLRFKRSFRACRRR